jgi:hypothetical protein
LIQNLYDLAIKRRGGQIVAQLMGQQPSPQVLAQPRAVIDGDRVIRQRTQDEADIVDVPFVVGVAQAPSRPGA